MTVTTGPTPDIKNNWQAALRDAGKHKGSIHAVTKNLREVGVAATTPVCWKLPDASDIDIRLTGDFPNIAATLATGAG